VVGDPIGRKVMVATAGEFFNLTFADEDKLAVAHIAQLLRSMMQLPAGEIPPRPTVAELVEQVESIEPIEGG